MTVLRSVSWDDAKKKRRRGAVAFAALFLVLPLAPVSRTAGTPRVAMATVIVESAPGAAVATRRAIADAGGAVLRAVGVIEGVIARVPMNAVANLRAARGVQSVVLDGRVRLSTTRDDASPELIVTVRGVGYKCDLDALDR